MDEKVAEHLTSSGSQHTRPATQTSYTTLWIRPLKTAAGPVGPILEVEMAASSIAMVLWGEDTLTRPLFFRVQSFNQASPRKGDY